MTETKRIRWDESNDTVPGYGTVFGWRGYVGSGDLHLFLVTKRSLDGDDYALVTELPWLDKKRSYDPDPDKLKAEAERWLEEFTSSLGAVFPKPAEHARQPLRMAGRQAQPRLCSCGEAWPCDGARNWHYGWAEDSRDGDGNLILRYEPSGGLYKVLPVEEC